MSLTLLWAETPERLLQAQVAYIGQYLFVVPKIVVFKRSERNVKMFLIINTRFGVSASSLIKSVERDTLISGRFGLDSKIACTSKMGTKQKIRGKALKRFPPNPSPVPAVGKHLAKHPLSSCSLQKFPELVQPTKTLISTKTHTTLHLSRQLK